jgi:hypothetical protein
VIGTVRERSYSRDGEKVEDDGVYFRGLQGMEWIPISGGLFSQ